MNNILDFQEEQSKLKEASRGTRLTNYLVDSIFLWLVNESLLTAIGLEIVVEHITPEVLESGEFLKAFLAQQLIQFVVIISYYLLSEYFLEGKTAGKYLTKTRAVDIDGQAMNFTSTLLRSLVRLVPFEAFSFLGSRENGWHDRWTKTMVVQE